MQKLRSQQSERPKDKNKPKSFNRAIRYPSEKNMRDTAVALKNATLHFVLPLFSVQCCVAPFISALKASIMAIQPCMAAGPHSAAL